MTRILPALVLLHAACTPSEYQPAAARVEPPVLADDELETLDPAVAHAVLCDHDPVEDPTFPDQADRLTRVFCQDAKGLPNPVVNSLADLQRALGLEFVDRNGGNGTGGNPGFALLGHSSALAGRDVSAAFPTAFVFTPPRPDGSLPPDYVFLAFDPGEHLAEVASFSPADQSVNLYLVVFTQDCQARAGGCTPTELLTPAITKNWSSVRFHESDTDELINTRVECQTCHIDRQAGPFDAETSVQILRMQEIEPPHTHWLSPLTEGGRALLADFHRVHGTTEDYGPIPASMVDKSSPELMARMITLAGFGEQPNAFASAAIEAEVKQTAPLQPAKNFPVVGTSPTWQAAHANGASGEFIAAPYHDVKVTDPTKLAETASAYQAWLAGEIPELPYDLRDVFLTDRLPEMGFAAAPGLDGRQLLQVACQQCHDSRLNPDLSRERFVVDQLDGMSRAEKDLAIERIELPVTTRLSMPPRLTRSTTPEQRAAMIAVLRR